MKRKTYLNMISSGISHSVRSSQVNPIRSIANPAFAQTNRQMIFNPLPYKPRQINYSAGVLYDNLQPFDRMFADKLSSFQSAQKYSDKTKQKLNELQKQAEASAKTDNPKN